MTIEFGNTELTELAPRIAVIGVGGAGCNAVNNMIAAELNGVDFVVANTDAQSLATSKADNRLQLGVQITQGLGAGAQPKVGAAAAEEALDVIDDMLSGCHMAFITAGMGGGTGTGAAPVIARRAREKGILTVGVVTRPFQFEGGRRMKVAEAGIADLAQHVDTLIIIPNQNLFRVADERTTFADAFNMADEVLHSGVRGITDLMVTPGLINLDFADVRTVMSEMGKAMMGTGEAEGETRAQDAAAAAISNPLLEEASLKGAKGVIINVTGGTDVTLFEVDQAVNMVREQADPDALIVFGSAMDDALEGKLRVSVVATGIEGGSAAIEIPQPVHSLPSDAVVEEKAAVEPLVEKVAEKTSAETVQEAQEIDQENAAQAPDTKEEMQVIEEKAPVVEVVAESPSDEDDLEKLALAAQEEGPHLEAPMLPKESVSFTQSTFHEGAVETDLPPEPADEQQVEEVVKVEAPAKRSLFQVMTAGLRNNDAEKVEKVAGPAVSNDLGSAQPAAGVSVGGVSEDDRPAPKVGKDQLEIPSFLRRQQN
ncbi:MAG: cell division protein FtsZ [Kordiimonadales bacterium]|nr:MAG: cell division protein FtsZ [Kordiimonadales bacterium]